LQSALLRFEGREFSDAALRRRAAEFTREQFCRRFEAVLQRARGAREELRTVCA